MPTQTPETAEKGAVKDWLELHGWFSFPLTATLGGHKGAPDRIAIKHGRVVCVEIKRRDGTGKQSADQKQFELDWTISGGEYVCGNYEDIVEVLSKSIPHARA